MNTTNEASSGMSKRTMFAILGGILLVIGVFAPVGEVLWVEVDYFQDGEGDGVLVLIGLAIAVPFLFMNRYKRGLWIPALLIAGIVGYDFLHFYSDLGTEFMGWGWIPLLIGAGLMITAAAVSD